MIAIPLKISTTDAIVVAVIDGDTLTAEIPGHDPFPVRIAGIDAPEIGQPFFDESLDRLAELTVGRPVRLETFPKFSWHRTVAKITANGKDVALELLRTGHAWFCSTHRMTLAGPDRLAYSDAERSARLARLGLWIDDHPVSPWDWRKKN